MGLRRRTPLVFLTRALTNKRRAIDIRQADAIHEAAFKERIRAAVAFNVATRKK